MGDLRERSSAERSERQERDAPTRVPSAPLSPTLAARGLGLDSMGNRARLSLLRSGRLQRKARVSQAGDPLEHQADRVADTVVTAERVGGTTRPDHAAPEIQRMPTEDEHLASSLGLSPVGGHAAPTHAPPDAPDSTGTEIVSQLDGGRGLDEQTRGLMESRFGESFSDVRVHTGHRAGESANSLHSRAFTVGEDIVFGEGEFAPETTEGRRLLAHELAHVVQQRRPEGGVTDEKQTERDAHEAAHEVASGGTPSVRERAAPGSVQKAPLKDVAADYETGEFGPGSAAMDWTISAEFYSVVKAFDVPLSERPKPRAWEDQDTKTLYVDPGTGGTSRVISLGRWQHVSLTSGMPRLPSPTPPPAPKPTPMKPKPKDVPSRPSVTPAPQVVPEVIIRADDDVAEPTVAPPEPDRRPEAKPQAEGPTPSVEVGARLRTIRSNLKSLTFNPWWDREIVTAFRESSPAELQQLQNALGEDGMNQVFDQLNPFFATLVGSFGLVTYGKSMLTEKRAAWLLEVSRWSPNQKSFMYYWMFQTMQAGDVKLLLSYLASQSHVHDTVSTQRGMKDYLAKRGINLDEYPETPLGAFRGAGRGLSDFLVSVGESIPAFGGAPRFGYEELPEPYRSQFLESASKDFFSDLTPSNIARGVASNVTLGYSDIPSGIWAGGKAGWEGMADIVAGKPGEGTQRIAPVAVMIFVALLGRRLSKPGTGGALASEVEGALLKPEGAGPGGTRSSPWEFRPAAPTRDGLQRFFARHAGGEIFEVAINPQTATGRIVHVRSGMTMHIENGQMASGPFGLLPTETGGGLPFDPFTPPGRTGAISLLPGVSTAPDWPLLPPSGKTLPLVGGGGPLPGGLPVPVPLALPPGPQPKLLGPGPISIGKAAESEALHRFDPNATQLPENFKAYDGVVGGERTTDLTFDRRSKKWVVNESINGGNWISVKKVLEKQTATPVHIAGVVEGALNDMFDAEHNPQRMPAHDPTPVDVGPTTYWRVLKDSPDSLTIVVQVSSELSAAEIAALQQVAENAAKTWPSIGDLPPVTVHVQVAP